MAAKKGEKPAKSTDGLVPLGLRNGKKFWRARIKWRDPLTGKVREAERTFEADSKLQAQNKRAAFLAEKRDAAVRPVERTRLAAVIDAYIATLTREGTLHSYRSYARKIKRKLGDAWVDAITTQHLQAFLSSVYLGKSTMDSIRVVLINAFDHAVAMGQRQDNPAKGTRVGRYKPAKPRKRKALTPDETVRLHADLRQHSYDLHVMMVAQYVLGCRFAEVSALTWEDVEMATGVVRIRRGQLKGVEGPPKGNKERDSALGPTALAMLAAHRKRMEQERWPGWERLVFPAPLGGQGKRPVRLHDYWPWKTVADHLKAAYGRLGYDLGAVTHVARHTANNVARMHANEVFLRKVIGHSSAEMTDAYTEIESTEVIDFAREQERRLLGHGGRSGVTRGPRNGKKA